MPSLSEVTLFYFTLFCLSQYVSLALSLMFLRRVSSSSACNLLLISSDRLRVMPSSSDCWLYSDAMMPPFLLMFTWFIIDTYTLHQCYTFNQAIQQVQLPTILLSCNDSGKLFTQMCLSPSSILWYQPKGDALWVGHNGSQTEPNQARMAQSTDKTMFTAKIH